MGDFQYLHITGVNDLPGYHTAAAFTTKSSEVFKEAEEISPRHVSEKVSYMPWGADDQMPYDIILLIESDETLSTCQMFNAEVCYGSGLVYQTDEWCKRKVVNEVEEFFLDNDMASNFYYYGYKLHALCGLSGVIHSYDLSKASVADLSYMKDVKLTYHDCSIYGDKGYALAE